MHSNDYELPAFCGQGQGQAQGYILDCFCSSAGVRTPTRAAVSKGFYEAGELCYLKVKYFTPSSQRLINPNCSYNLQLLSLSIRCYQILVLNSLFWGLSPRFVEVYLCVFDVACFRCMHGAMYKSHRYMVYVTHVSQFYLRLSWVIFLPQSRTTRAEYVQCVSSANDTYKREEQNTVRNSGNNGQPRPQTIPSKQVNQPVLI